MGVNINEIKLLVKQYYNEGEWFEESDKQKLKKLMGSLFDEMDYGRTENGKIIQGKDGKLSINEDGITDEYATLFGLTKNNSLTREQFLAKIDTVAKTLGEDEKDFPTQYRKANFKLEEVNVMTPKEAYKAGYDAFKKMQWDTDYTQHMVINENLEQLTPENVVKFLEGYNAAKSGANFMHRNEGIMEMMDDEYDKGKIEMKNKKRLVETLLKAAEAKGLKNSPNYRIINNIMKNYRKGGKLAGATDFNQNHEFTAKACGSAVGGGAAAGVGTACLVSNPIGWVVAGVAALGAAVSAACDRKTDNERLDEAMNALLEEIKNK